MAAVTRSRPTADSTRCDCSSAAADKSTRCTRYEPAAPSAASSSVLSFSPLPEPSSTIVVGAARRKMPAR